MAKKGNIVGRCTCKDPVATPRKPTPQEVAWIERLKAVLADAPPGIGLLTGGDDLVVYDKKIAKELGIEHLCDSGSELHGVLLGRIFTPTRIDAVTDP